MSSDDVIWMDDDKFSHIVLILSFSTSLLSPHIHSSCSAFSFNRKLYATVAVYQHKSLHFRVEPQHDVGEIHHNSDIVTSMESTVLKTFFNLKIHRSRAKLKENNIDEITQKWENENTSNDVKQIEYKKKILCIVNIPTTLIYVWGKVCANINNMVWWSGRILKKSYVVSRELKTWLDDEKKM